MRPESNTSAWVRHLQDAREPSINAVGDLTFAFLGYNGVSHIWDGAAADSPGTSPMIEEYVREDVARATADGHIVVPFFHWGVEYVPWPTDEQRRIAHAAIEAGAAAVIGSHPHWVQAIESYQGRPIIYSLGNFVFDQAWSRETMEGMIADLWFEGLRLPASISAPYSSSTNIARRCSTKMARIMSSSASGTPPKGCATPSRAHLGIVAGARLSFRAEREISDERDSGARLRSLSSFEMTLPWGSAIRSKKYLSLADRAA